MTTDNKVSNHLEPWCDLEGKVVMVTGASSGLGREFCLDLAKAGCRIIAAARRTDRLKSLCDEINALSSASSWSSNSMARAVAVELDITADGPTIDMHVKNAWDAFGRIDVLINNAGVRGTYYYELYFDFNFVLFLFSGFNFCLVAEKI